MKTGSDINITCVVSGHLRDSPITWYYASLITQAKPGVREIHAGGRGGVQLVTDRHAGSSWLLVNHATWRDAGNYTCAPLYARPASVIIHVVDGKTLSSFFFFYVCVCVCVCVCVVLAVPKVYP